MAAHSNLIAYGGPALLVCQAERRAIRCRPAWTRRLSRTGRHQQAGPRLGTSKPAHGCAELGVGYGHTEVEGLNAPDPELSTPHSLPRSSLPSADVGAV
jgi:hypothetical protein